MRRSNCAGSAWLSQWGHTMGLRRCLTTHHLHTVGKCQARRCMRAPSTHSGITQLLISQRFQSSMEGQQNASQQADQQLTHEQVWALWNEGNLFALTLTQLQSFLRSTGARVDAGERKAALVRRVEEYLHAKDAQSAGGAPSPMASGGADQRGYGRWDSPALPPETLLDLRQSGFYEGASNMVPKAFQLLPEGAVTDAVVARINTTAFPGFPANTECYSVRSADGEASTRARFSKALQWCLLNLRNLHMDAEVHIHFGKLLLHQNALVAGENVVSTYTLQQRLQLRRPYTWISTIPESATTTIEEFLTQKEGFTRITSKSTLSYEAIIQRAGDRLSVDLDHEAKFLSLNAEWVDVQTTHQTHTSGPDVQFLLRTRPPMRREEVERYRSIPMVELTADDVVDVLPAEHGQLVYLAECETHRFEKTSEDGGKIAVTRVKRQPLIVLHDSEEDCRVEYTVVATVPATGGGKDGRLVGLELMEFASRFADTTKEAFDAAYGLHPNQS